MSMHKSVSYVSAPCREGASVDAEANRRRSSGAREDDFSADSAVGARRPPHPNPLPDGGEGTLNPCFGHRWGMSGGYFSLSSSPTLAKGTSPNFAFQALAEGRGS